METLKNWVEGTFDIPMDMLIPKGIELYSMYKGEDMDSTYLVGSKEAKKECYLIQADIGAFIKKAPKGYFTLGHYGYGACSYALYYCRVDSWSKIFFRLGYGNFYADNDRDAKDIHEFLIKYFEFENMIRGKVSSLIAIDSMGLGYYQVCYKRQKIEVQESLLMHPDFKSKFKELYRDEE